MNGLGYSIYERGMAEGIDLFGKLIAILMESGRIDDARKAATDEAVREQFLREFHLIE